MAMTTCQECGKDVSDQARACPHCGTPGPADASPSPRKLPRWVIPAAGVALVALAALIGVQTGLIPVSRMDDYQIEPVIEKDLSETFGGRVEVDCPDKIWQQKGRITDCTATLPSGRTGQVFVEQVDAGGHFRFQLESGVAQAEIGDKIDRDAADIQEQIEKDTEAAIAALPKQTFIETCKGEYGEVACDCTWTALNAAERDDALIGFLSGEPTPESVAALEECGA